MDPARNPFAPSVDGKTPEPAGRKPIFEVTRIVIQQALIGKSSLSQMVPGLLVVGR